MSTDVGHSRRSCIDRIQLSAYKQGARRRDLQGMQHPLVQLEVRRKVGWGATIVYARVALSRHPGLLP